MTDEQHGSIPPHPSDSEAAAPLISTPSHVLNNEAPAMLGARNDALPITPPSSYLDQPTTDEASRSAAAEHGGMPSTTQMGVQIPSIDQNQDFGARMLGAAAALIPQEEPHPPRIRVHFDEFAAQIRLHRQQDRHARMLRLRQESLQKSIALTARLHRVGRLIHDGLVNLSGHGDKTAFARVYHCMNDLSESCHYRWKNEVQLSNVLSDRDASDPSTTEEYVSFISKISQSSRKDLFRLLHSIRSDPQFLVERIKALSPSQLEAFCTTPGEECHASISTLFPQTRTSMSQSRRDKAFATSLEDYAISLERTNPLNFMLCNLFGDGQGLTQPEDCQRLDTWASVCAHLYLESDAYLKLISRILHVFASLQGWRMSERLELYLMDILQQGAVLLDLVDRSTPPSFHTSNLEPLETPQTEAFFESAVQDLIRILNEQDGGLPPSALQLVSAILGKMTSEEDQSRFRGYVFFHWFLGEFLRTAIEYPETENMLLQSYVSKSARASILHKLWFKTEQRISDVYSPFPSKPVPDAMRDRVGAMINNLPELHLPEPPYSAAQEYDVSMTQSEDPASHQFIVFGPTEVIHLIDTLCPQPALATTAYDPFLAANFSAFQNQYARPPTNSKTNFDQLRRELSLFVEPTFTSRLPHPCQERWTVCAVGIDGRIFLPETRSLEMPAPSLSSETCLEARDITQKAAVRLAGQHKKLLRSSSSRLPSSTFLGSGNSLAALFKAELRHAQERVDNVDAHYWYQALKNLRDYYPMSQPEWKGDDTQILRPLLEASRRSQSLLETKIAKGENQLLVLKELYSGLRCVVVDALTRLDKLRDRLWYAVDVINSGFYDDAKNIAAALNNMAIPTTMHVETPHDALETRSVSSSSRSLSESLFSQPQKDTMSMLKAPSEHGGPKKLAESQLERTRKWLKKSNIENFCMGEERIHRFCMEIKLLVKKLASEDRNESPVLWSSELYTKERALCFENPPGLFLGSSAGTRPPSVKSDTLSSTYHASRGAHHGLETGSRILGYDAHSSPARKSSFHSLGSTRIRTETLPQDLSSFNGSPDRAYSSTASDTVSSMFSPMVAQSQSATTMSIRSRPSSTYNDIETAKLADQSAREKAKFLEDLQQELVCLLLSDLACPVWSCGSETDAWLAQKIGDPRISHRMRQRHTTARLISKSRTAGRYYKQKRSTSVAPESHTSKITKPMDGVFSSVMGQTSILADQFSYAEAYQALLDKCSQYVDPMDKLQAISDMKTLVMAELEESGKSSRSATRPKQTSSGVRSAPSSRRSSFDPSKSSGLRESTTVPRTPDVTTPEGTPGHDIIGALKERFLELKPKTLFRDLQYISVFVPSEVLNKTERGKALMDFGLAALAYKADVAQAMFDVADRVIKEQKNMGDAVQLLMIAAQEGNKFAQREVAVLYLSQPEMTPIVSLPLSLPSETFKSEMMWQKRGGDVSVTNSQAMCLALHWMQLAANNGDKMAKEKLDKRKEKEKDGVASIR